MRYGDLGNRSDIYLFDIQDEHNSFGVNLLACDDPTSLREREITYNRAFGVFIRLWGHEFIDRPWLRLIIQHTLRAFLETPGLTLAEVPLFLDPSNHAFRSFVVRNMTANAPVADFWLNQFAAKKSDDQQKQVDAARTRVQELLADPYVRDIVGQPETTLDFAEAMEQRQVLLFKLPQTLAPDTKRFIGTILLSELLLAVHGRDRIPSDERYQFCIYVDEVQHFAHSDDFTTLFTEARKYGIATTIAHQERYGQFADRKKMAGATAAAANKIFFQTTVMDAQELAAEFADIAEEIELKEEASTVLSPHVLEDLWDKGHPDPWIIHFRDRYFWIVDALRSSRPETDVLCRPAKQAGFEKGFLALALKTGLSREKADALRNPGLSHIDAFTDSGALPFLS